MAKTKVVAPVYGKSGPEVGAALSAGSGFWSSFALGLGAMTLLGSQGFTPPQYSRDGVGQSWRGVGDHMRAAMRKIEER